MNRLNWLFNEQRTLRAGWRFVLVLAIYILSGKILDWILTKIHFPERAFNLVELVAELSGGLCICRGDRVGDVTDRARALFLLTACARVKRRRAADEGRRLGFIPSALILVPIYLRADASSTALRSMGRELAFYAFAWGMAMLALGFAEEFLFRGYALKTLAESIGFWPASNFPFLDFRTRASHLQASRGLDRSH